MLSLLFSNPLYFFIFIISLIIAVTIHEFAHAWTADKLGDPTPRLNDRLTLNPLAHLDTIGTLALLIARIGWGKPVPIDPYNFQKPRRDTALVSLAGPGSNLTLALLISLVFKLIIKFPIEFIYLAISRPNTLLVMYRSGQIPVSTYLISLFIGSIIILNITLAVFNLLPIPPLDGSKILLGFLPSNLALAFEEGLSQYGTFLLIFLIFPFFGGTSLISRIIFPIIDFITNLLL